MLSWYLLSLLLGALTALYFWFDFQPHWEAGGILELHGQNPEGSGILPGQQSRQPRAEPCGRLWV